MQLQVENRRIMDAIAMLTFRVHNFMNSCRWLSGSEIADKTSISFGEKKRLAKAMMLFFIFLVFSSTSIPI